MDLARLFEIANLAAIAGWLCLLATPFAPRISNLVGGLFVPIVLSVGYVALMGWLLAGGPGSDEPASFDFFSLDGVVAVFSLPEAVLIGWVHYLAFDLFVGGWEARTGHREGIPFLLVVPCLAATLFAGPAGFLMFMVLRSVWRRRMQASATA